MSSEKRFRIGKIDLKGRMGEKRKKKTRQLMTEKTPHVGGFLIMVDKHLWFMS